VNTAVEQAEMVFVIGCPRSGTYLLTTLLSEFTDISFPVETHFIPLFEPFLPLWGDLALKRNRQRLLKCIYDFLEIWTVRSEKGRPVDKIREFSLLSTIPEKNTIAKRANSYSEIVNLLFQIYSQKHGKKQWGDKSVYFNEIPTEKLYKVVPNCKIIHIVRDGRDVCLSWMDTWFGPRSFSEAAKNWVDHVRNKRMWGEVHPDKYLEIKYEELLENTKQTLENVCQFLHLTLASNAENYEPKSELASILSSGGHHKLLSSPIDPNNKNKWKSSLSTSQLELFEYIGGKTLQSCEYEIQHFHFSGIKKLELQILMQASWFKGYFFAYRWRLILKKILPLVLFMSDLLKIPLVKILNHKSS